MAYIDHFYEALLAASPGIDLFLLEADKPGILKTYAQYITNVGIYDKAKSWEALRLTGAGLTASDAPELQLLTENILGSSLHQGFFNYPQKADKDELLLATILLLHYAPAPRKGPYRESYRTLKRIVEDYYGVKLGVVNDDNVVEQLGAALFGKPWSCICGPDCTTMEGIVKAVWENEPAFIHAPRPTTLASSTIPNDIST